ncbi:MAG: response regulator transcription factor [Anaerolineales bacterium]
MNSPQRTTRAVLLIDDDTTLCELLSEHLQAAGYQPIVANDGAAGVRLAGERQPDLVVLDVMMPGMDGWQVCEQLRARASVPIIMLTAKGEELDKLRGFRLGVDDYVTKPFSFAELTARIRAVLARAQTMSTASDRAVMGNVAFDFQQRRVTVAGRPVELTPTEYRMLEVLARHAGRPVPTEQLLREVWGDEYAREADHVKHYIWALRKKIEADPGDPKHLITERGFGYRFE